MQKRIKAVIEMYNECSAFMQRNAGKFAGYEPLEEAVISLNARIALVQEAVMEREKNLKGFAADKKKKLKLMVQLADVMRNKVQSVLLANGDQVGYINTHITSSDMLYTNSIHSSALVANILKLAKEVSAADKLKFLISETDITDLENAAESFHTASTLRRSMQVDKKTQGQLLGDQIKSTSTFIRTTMNGLMGNYKVSDKAFYAEWEYAKTIMNPAQNHGQILGTVADALTEQPLQMVKVTATHGERVYEDMTDRRGFYKLPLNPDLWNVSFELPPYDKLEKDDVLVWSGKRQQLNVKLVKPG